MERIGEICDPVDRLDELEVREGQKGELERTAEGEDAPDVTEAVEFLKGKGPSGVQIFSYQR